MLLQGLSIRSKCECKKSVYSALGGKVNVDVYLPDDSQLAEVVLQEQEDAESSGVGD